MVKTFWEMLPSAERELVRRESSLRRFAPGEVLCQRDDSSRQVFVLLTGYADVIAERKDGFETVLTICVPGDIVGELAAIDSDLRSATVRASQPVQALSMPGARFCRLLQTNASLTWAVLQVLTSRVRRMTHQKVTYAGGSVAARVVSLLLDLATQRGVPIQGGVVIAAISQQSLANMVVSSRVAVARVLRDLREKELIITGRERLIIPSTNLLIAELDYLSEA